MSADNYAVCPRCNPAPPWAEADYTLREDWEIGYDGNQPGDTVGTIYYKAECSKCGATAEINTAVYL